MEELLHQRFEKEGEFLHTKESLINTMKVYERLQQ